MSNEEDLIDYSDEELQTTDAVPAAANGSATNGDSKKGDLTVTGAGADKKGSYSMESSGRSEQCIERGVVVSIHDHAQPRWGESRTLSRSQTSSTVSMMTQLTRRRIDGSRACQRTAPTSGVSHQEEVEAAHETLLTRDSCCGMDGDRCCTHDLPSIQV
ncbi:hypothetical protein MRB53_038412 [Persea americana]|nr:hypothetical protein MRB53_038412 [Persea americana]